jgi:hypothetical protein
MEGWSTFGLSVAQIIDLRNQVVKEYERSPDRFHTIFDYRPDSSTNWGRSSDFPFWDEVRESLEGLRDAKLPLTLSNVLTYGRMSGDQILSAIRRV